LVKKIIIVKNATAYTWDWYCHQVVDRASLACSNILIQSLCNSFSGMFHLNKHFQEKGNFIQGKYIFSRYFPKGKVLISSPG
jgi:hypothetical protein